MHRTLKLTAFAGVIAAAATMCSPASALPANNPQYVSMGSSYASGPGVGVRVASSGACGRSQSNYAQLLAARRHLTLVDVSCSFAIIPDILSRSQNGFPPQIDAVNAQTRLVTVTIGGNDVFHTANIYGYSCRDTGGHCPVVPDAKVEQGFAALPGALRAMIAEVHHRAPDAKLVLIGELPVLPPSGALCPAVPLSPKDLAHLRPVTIRLNNILATVAAQTHTLFVNTSVIGNGHDACSATPYIAGFKPGVTPGWGHPVPYHPNQAGMNRLADAIDKVLGPKS